MIIAIIVLIYGAFSTIFHNTNMVGKVGSAIGRVNIELFGYMAYVNMLILLYPLYRVYKNPNLAKRVDFIVGWILVFIELCIFCGLVFSEQNAGFIGSSLVAFLTPLIGKLGVWLFFIMISVISVILTVDDDFDWVAFFKNLMDKRI